MPALIKGDETAAAAAAKSLQSEGNALHHELQVVVWDYRRKEHAHHPQFGIWAMERGLSHTSEQVYIRQPGEHFLIKK